MKIRTISNYNFNNFINLKNKIPSHKPCGFNSNPVQTVYPKNYYISFGKQIKPFSSLDSANKYFLDNYGISADFKSTEQAETMDLAIKDFISKTNIKDKKLLEGIEIASYDMKDDRRIKIAAQVQQEYNLDDETLKIANDYKAQDKFSEFIQKYKPESLNCKVLRLGLMLNDNFRWGKDDFEESKTEIFKALATLIHLKSSPFDFAVKNKSNPTEAQIKIMSAVAKTSDKNKFIEQYILEKLSGKTFSKEVTELYRDFGGPNLFNDWVDYDFAGVQFKSLKDAEKYFLNEYGINANFTDLEQAYVVKCAIDDFLALETIKDRKFLKGVNIDIKDKMHDDTKDSRAEVDLEGYEFIFDRDVNQLYEQYRLENRTSDFFKENKPDKINIKKVTMLMKKSFDWKARPKGKYYMADVSRETIHHEIGHILHIKNNPFLYIVNCDEEKITTEELETMKKVSNYATKNKLEFIAEYIASRLEGRIFDEDVIELYRSLGGPNLFNDWE